MNNNVIKALLGGCLLLLAVLFIEWQTGKPDDQVAVISTAAKQKQDPLIQLPKLILSKQTAESYTQMVETPLFIQGRKPIENDNEEEIIEEDASKIDDLVLQGLYSVKGNKIALFKAKGKDQGYLKKTQGEDVNGWQLIEIKADSVVMEQSGKKQSLMLRKPKLKSPKRAKLIRNSRKKRNINLEK
ncbi:MAG: hypothetical protein QM500_08440 [Methylococcales bacterium]